MIRAAGDTKREGRPTAANVAARSAPVGILCAGVLFTLADLKAIGLGGSALRQARRNGLVLRRLGRTTFCSGAELLRYLDECCPKVDAAREPWRPGPAKTKATEVAPAA